MGILSSVNVLCVLWQGVNINFLMVLKFCHWLFKQIGKLEMGKKRRSTTEMA